MKTIFFVCTGNAARSQMAELMWAAHFGADSAVSAGTEVVVGKPMPEDLVSAMKDAGYDTSHCYRKQITEQMVEVADRVVLMTDRSLPDYLKDSPKVIRWQVDDPRGLGLEAHLVARDIIAGLVDKLAVGKDS